MLFSSKHTVKLYHGGQTEPFLTFEIKSQNVEIVDAHTIKTDGSVLTFGSDVFVAVDQS